MTKREESLFLDNKHEHSMLAHIKSVEFLQKQIKEFSNKRNLRKDAVPISIKDFSGSNTTRSKSYKRSCPKLDVASLNRIIEIDQNKRVALVEPRVTMEKLVEASLSFGLIPAVVPEFKGITVGGAIMGGAAESSSHQWGCFNDACLAVEIICGDGSLIRASQSENQDIFYGIAGSYGSLGLLVLAEIQLISAKDYVHLRYHTFSSSFEALEFIQRLSHVPNAADFLDAIIFAKDLAVVIEGNMLLKENISEGISQFSLNSISSEWYYQHAQKIASKLFNQPYEEVIALRDYLFRYDQGAFWIGAYLFRLPLLVRFIWEGIFNFSKPALERFNKDQVEKLHKVPFPKKIWRILCHSLMNSQTLWKLQHKAEKWVQDHVVIQDFCIPEIKAAQFLKEVLEDPGIFPLWLCPIKGTSWPQIFTPHFLPRKARFTHFINVGIYGLPCYFASIEQITRKLEQQTKDYGGRKVLYSRSYYTHGEFWQIYSQESYNALRNKTSSAGIWHEITEKVLSE